MVKGRQRHKRETGGRTRFTGWGSRPVKRRQRRNQRDGSTGGGTNKGLKRRQCKRKEIANHRPSHKRGGTKQENRKVWWGKRC